MGILTSISLSNANAKITPSPGTHILREADADSSDALCDMYALWVNAPSVSLPIGAAMLERLTHVYMPSLRISYDEISNGTPTGILSSFTPFKCLSGGTMKK